MAKKAAAGRGAGEDTKGASRSKDGKEEKPYVVFARRFRPNRFADVAGQTAIISALRQALKSGRLAQAYLFCGPRGVGKTSLARIVAKALNCLKGSGPGGMAEDPCNECEACVAIQEGRSLDVIEMDAATNRGIEEIRSLRESVGLSPAELRYKVYIIDEVHMLTKEAWNAFLKTLEEPPVHVKFIFATTDPNNVPETILSRCQRYDLRRIGPSDIIKRLKQICELEEIECEEMALSRIASLARGGLRDAEGLLDQAVNLGSGKVTDAVVRDLAGSAPDELIFELLENCAKGQTAEVLRKTHTTLEAGADPDDMLEVLVERLRGTLLAKVCGGDSDLLEGQIHLKDAMAKLGALLSEDQILMLIQLFNTARKQTRDAAQARLPLEMALIRASRAGDLVELGKLVKAVESGALAGASTGRPGQAPIREGPRPNSPGRLADSVSARPAAQQTEVRASLPAETGEETSSNPAGTETRPTDLKSRLIAAARSQKGGALLAGALTHSRSMRVDEGTGELELAFATEQMFYADTLEKPHNRTALQAALTVLFSREFSIKVRRDDSTPPPAPPLREGSARSSAPARNVTPAPASNAQLGTARATIPNRAPQVPPLTGQSSDEVLIEPEGELEGDGETEFVMPEELPLRTPVPPSAAESETPATSGNEDELPPTVPVRAQRLTPPAARLNAAPTLNDADRKSIEQHPLIQIILKESDGVVMNVERGIRPAARENKEKQK